MKEYEREVEMRMEIEGESEWIRMCLNENKLDSCIQIKPPRTGLGTLIPLRI